MGRRLNLRNPERFTEKMQWYKLHYKNPLLIQCVDKYDVREYVKEKGLGDILVPCYGVFDDAKAIQWDSLPNQFVMKDTLGGGGNSVIIINDKKRANIEKLMERATRWTTVPADKKGSGREWPYYSGKKRRAIFEKYLDAGACEHGLLDYKFFCFSGKVVFIYVMGDRRVGQEVSVGIYNRDFNKLPVLRIGDKDIGTIEKPKNYERMIKIAETLSKDFPHVRVDLYNLDGVIYFGELTFYNASGYMKFDPDSFDKEIGKKFPLIEFEEKK